MNDADKKLAREYSGGQRWLALQLGISRQRVNKIVRSPGWPYGAGPWTRLQLPSIKTHVNERRAMNPATAAQFDEDGRRSEDATVEALSKNPERVAKLKLIIERTVTLRFQRELMTGAYLRREDVERDSVRRIHETRAKMQEMPLRAALIAQRSEAEITPILSAWVNEICDTFAAAA